MAYGYDLGDGETDHFVDITDKTLTRLNDLTSSLFLIDYLPFCESAPELAVAVRCTEFLLFLIYYSEAYSTIPPPAQISVPS